jgi:hypothetical protein
MSRLRAEIPCCSSRARWLLPAALLALTPKCVLCVLAYAGLGTALGLGGPELCGVAGDSSLSWATVLAWFGVAGALGVIGNRRFSTHATAKDKMPMN